MSRWNLDQDHLIWLFWACSSLVALFALVLALSTSILSYRFGMGIPSNWSRIVRAALIVTVLLFVLVGIGFLLARGQDARDSALRLERLLVVTSGVSTIYPILLLIVASGALIFNCLNDLYLLEQHMPDYPTHADRKLAPDDSMWLADCELQDERHKYTRVVREQFFFLRPRSPLHFLTIALSVLYFLYFIAPLASRLVAFMLPTRSSHSIDGQLFDYSIAAVIILIFIMLIMSVMRLTLMWKSLCTIIKLFLHLPVGRSLGWMSTRVARWFFESPRRNLSRFDLIRRQAQTLGERSTPDVERSGKVNEDELKRMWRQIIEKAAGGNPDKRAELTERWGIMDDPDARWKKLKENVTQVSAESVMEVREMLFPIILAYWNTLTVDEAYPEVGESGAAVAASGEPAEPEPADASLAAWGASATDFIALLFVSWLAAATAQIWRRIAWLVLAVLALLLAVNSYPFGFQDRMLLGLFLLVAYLAVLIIWIVVGINREELIRRIATTPQGLSMNGPLVRNLLTYIVPLLGTLAAVSFNITDTFHTFLDPILRHLR